MPLRMSPSVESASPDDVAEAVADEATLRQNADATHAAAADPHSAAAYGIMVGGGRRIWVQAADPGGSAANGDIWIDTT